MPGGLRDLLWDATAGFNIGRYVFPQAGNDEALHSPTVLLWTKMTFDAAGILIRRIGSSPADR
jgi:hypothetical protein